MTAPLDLGCCREAPDGDDEGSVQVRQFRRVHLGKGQILWSPSWGKLAEGQKSRMFRSQNKNDDYSFCFLSNFKDTLVSI